MTREELMKRLNAITKAEFETNWNLGEIARTVKNDVRKDSPYNILARELEQDLNKDVEEGHVYKVSGLGFVTLYEKVSEGNIQMLKAKETIHSENSYIIPYSYVMGKKVSKTVYLNTLSALH